MSTIALIPGLFALIWCFRYSPYRAAFDVYIPVMLLIPGFCRWEFQGLPDLSFSQAAILPLSLFLLTLPGKWRWSRLDLWLTLFVLEAAYSESTNRPLPDAIATFTDMLTVALLPYLLGKALIESAGLRERYGRRIVLLLCGVAILCIFEFRMGVNLFTKCAALFFPLRQNNWVTQIRWGFGRVAGPFSHAILAGLVFSIGLLLNFWLTKTGAWRNTWFNGRLGGVKKTSWIQLVLTAGMCMTLSRGPILGCMCGLAIASIGVANNLKRRALQVLALITFLIGGALAATLYTTEGGWDYQETGTVETVAYRRELIASYAPLVQQGGLWGWGRVQPPKVPEQPSVDNQYLLVALTQGYAGLSLFLFILAETTYGLVRIASRPIPSADRIFIMALLGAVVATCVSMATVYLGAQGGLVFFLIVGWADSLAASVRKPLPVQRPEYAVPLRAAPFRKLLA